MNGSEDQDIQIRDARGLSRRQLLTAGAGAAGIATGASIIAPETAGAFRRPSTVRDVPTVAAPTARAFMQVTAQKQGKFKSEKGSYNIPILAYGLDVAVPVDPSSGLASGRRQWKPIVVTKTIDASSPQFMQSLVTNEILISVKLTLVRTIGKLGKVQPYFQISLTNAILIDLMHFASDTPERHMGAYPLEELEEISFVFQKIEIDDLAGKTAAIDDWQSPA